MKKVWKISDGGSGNLKDLFVADECLETFMEKLFELGQPYTLSDKWGNGTEVQSYFYFDPGGMVRVNEPLTSLDIGGYRFEFRNREFHWLQQEGKEAAFLAVKDNKSYVIMYSWPNRINCFPLEVLHQLNEKLSEDEEDIIRISDEFIEEFDKKH